MTTEEKAIRERVGVFNVVENLEDVVSKDFDPVRFTKLASEVKKIYVEENTEPHNDNKG